MKFTSETSLKVINNAPELTQAKGCLIAGGDFFTGDNGELTLSELQKKNPTWNAGDIIFGLEHLLQVAQTSEQYVYPVYSAEEVEHLPRLGSVRLIFLPAKQRKRDTYAILLAGGAYGSVCTMVESLPVAAKLNDMGISCFCLNYRIASQESFISGLLPEPLDDLAAAWKYIRKNQKIFGVNAEDYIVGGFSAGGHLASLWGTSHMGARKYGIVQPKMLILAYPLITAENMPSGPLRDMMCTGMFGAGFTLDDIRRYDASGNIDSNYPKTYLVRSIDDRTVSLKDADNFMSAMKTAGVTNQLQQAQTGGHGFGLGTATPLSGWVERAIMFFDE
jgi:acetyl esterase/lipase